MNAQIHQLLKEIGPGKMSSTAYDTAWVARLGEIDWDLSSQALNWLCENQLPDGSWGADKPFYYHDRVISTLAAMIALTHCGRRSKDKVQIEKGLLALERITDGLTQGLLSDPNGETVGFEMIVPTLVAEAERLNLLQRQAESILVKLDHKRKIKLGLLKGKIINRYITAAFSAEMAGKDGQEMFDIDNLQENNGSVGHSPSATAYFASFVKPANTAALSYLHKFTNAEGGMPNLTPFDVFEASWVLWNFSLVTEWDDKTKSLFQPLVNFLRQGWIPNKGIGLSVGYSIPDGDDTSLVYEVLSRFGRQEDINTVLSFEESEYFRTYSLEANSSNSVNIHALGALRQAGMNVDSEPVQKVLKFLKRKRVYDSYWFDKWNLSAYYTTSHAIIACAGFANELVRPSVDWIVSTQQADGSWGFQYKTSEETAYCLQALIVWIREGGKVPKVVLQKAVKWLEDHKEPPYPPLWIGKGLYTPEHVVRSAILSALYLAKQNFN